MPAVCLGCSHSIQAIPGIPSLASHRRRACADSPGSLGRLPFALELRLPFRRCVSSSSRRHCPATVAHPVAGVVHQAPDNRSWCPCRFGFAVRFPCRPYFFHFWILPKSSGKSDISFSLKLPVCLALYGFTPVSTATETIRHEALLASKAWLNSAQTCGQGVFRSG